jgi:hypothetical protein
VRKTNLFGATFLALTASAWSLSAVAQTAATAPAAPMAAPATPAPEPAAPTAAPDASSAPASGDTSAPASSKPMKKTMHHKMMHSHGKLAATPAGNAAVEDLNDASLNAAKTGKPFVAPTTPPAAKKTAHMGGHKMHHMSKPKGDATAPTAPADSSTPSDSSGK